MEQAFITDKTYDNIEFGKTPLGKGEYEDCNFFNCDFSNTDLSELTFIACRFVGCNLSLATLTKTSFQDDESHDSTGRYAGRPGPIAAAYQRQAQRSGDFESAKFHPA